MAETITRAVMALVTGRLNDGPGVIDAFSPTKALTPAVAWATGTANPQWNANRWVNNQDNSPINLFLEGNTVKLFLSAIVSRTITKSFALSTAWVAHGTPTVNRQSQHQGG